MSYQTLQDARENLSDTGDTLFGTVGGTTLELAQIPTAADAYEMVYFAGIVPLAEGNQTNWLLTNHPDLLLYGSLIEAEAFIMNDERLPVWREFFDRAVHNARQQIWRNRTGGGPLRMRSDVVV